MRYFEIMTNVIDFSKYLKAKQIDNTVDKINELVKNLDNPDKIDELKQELERFHDMVVNEK